MAFMRVKMQYAWTAAAVVAALVAGVSTARAQSAVWSSPPDSAELRELRVAVADGPATSTVWFGARLYGAADDVFVVVPAGPGAAVDLSTDAWFESLEDATNTRVLPPSKAPDACPAAQLPKPGDHDMIGDAAHEATIEPSLPVETFSLSELVVWAQGLGLDLSFDAMSAFADLDVAGYRFVLLRYEVPPGAVNLATVRVASTQALAMVPLVVTSAGALPADVRVWSFTSGRANPGQFPWATVDPADVQWQLGDGQLTNYREVIASILDENAWVVDAASHASIFRSTALSGGASPISSLVEGYFERASGYGDAQADPTACIARVASFESSQAAVAGACAPGVVAVLPGGACVEAPLAGQIDPEDLRCGGIADDLALAMSGIVPEQRWLSRWTGRLPAWTARARETLDLGGEALSPEVVCGGWDTSVCEADAGTGGSGSGSGGGSGGSGGAPNTGGTGHGGGTSPYVPPSEDPYYDDDYDEHTEVYVEGSCWGDTSSTTTENDSEDDSCSGDSTSASDEEDSCAGDSSSASEDESCAGDSSDSSDGSDDCSGDSSDSSDGSDACSGDSSDSSSGSDACSGDSSSGSSSAGDSCSGGSSSGSSESDCSVSAKGRGKPSRLPTSAFALLIVASGLAARRWRKAEEARVPFR